MRRIRIRAAAIADPPRPSAVPVVAVRDVVAVDHPDGGSVVVGIAVRHHAGGDLVVPGDGDMLRNTRESTKEHSDVYEMSNLSALNASLPGDLGALEAPL